MERNLHFKIDWANLIVGRKFTIFAFLYLRAIFKHKHKGGGGGGGGGLILFWRGNLTEGFLRYEFGGLIHGGPYFRIFTVIIIKFVIILDGWQSFKHLYR